MRRLISSCKFASLAFILLLATSVFGDDVVNPELLPTSDQASEPIPHFPTRTAAFIWRNWNVAPLESLARTLDVSPDTVAEFADRLGLPRYSFYSILASQSSRRNFAKTTFSRSNWAPNRVASRWSTSRQRLRRRARSMKSRRSRARTLTRTRIARANRSSIFYDALRASRRRKTKVSTFSRLQIRRSSCATFTLTLRSLATRCCRIAVRSIPINCYATFLRAASTACGCTRFLGTWRRVAISFRNSALIPSVVARRCAI